MSFNSNIWEERLCQWKLARERLLRRTGSQEEIPDPSDLGSVDEMELRQPEMYANYCHSEYVFSIRFRMLLNITWQW